MIYHSAALGQGGWYSNQYSGLKLDRIESKAHSHLSSPFRALSLTFEGVEADNELNNIMESQIDLSSAVRSLLTATECAVTR